MCLTTTHIFCCVPLLGRHHFNSESPSSASSRTEDRVNFETQQEIPENFLQNGTDDFQTMASKQYENTEAQEEEPEIKTIPDLKQENEDVFSMNEEYQKLDSSIKAAHSSNVENYAEVHEINQVWAEKCLHPELRDYSHQISKPETEPQQSEPVWAYKCLHPELRDYAHQTSLPKTEPQQLQGDTEELDEEIQEYKMEKEESLDMIEENQEFSVSDPDGLQEASTDNPQSSNMDNDGLQEASEDIPQSSNMDIAEEKNVLVKKKYVRFISEPVMEVEKQTSEEEQLQDSGRKNKRSFIDAIRACFCSCFTKKLSSSPHHKK